MWPFSKKQVLPKEPVSYQFLAAPVFAFRCKCGELLQVNVCDNYLIENNHLSIRQPITAECCCGVKYKSKYVMYNEGLKLIHTLKFEEC